MWITLWITQNKGIQDVGFTHKHNTEKRLWKVPKKPYSTSVCGFEKS